MSDFDLEQALADAQSFLGRIITTLVCLLSLIIGGIAFALYSLGCAGISAGRAVAMWIARRL